MYIPDSREDTSIFDGITALSILRALFPDKLKILIFWIVKMNYKKS